MHQLSIFIVDGFCKQNCRSATKPSISPNAILARPVQASFFLFAALATQDAFADRLSPADISSLGANISSVSLPQSTPATTVIDNGIQLSPRRYISLAAEIPARLARIAVKDGEWFKAGQLLIQLDCALQASPSKVEKSSAELTQINKNLSKCSIRAPFAGRVAEQKARENEFVQVGQPILEIIDDSQLEFEFIIPSKWLIWIKPGQKFKVTIDETGKTYPARIQRLGARIDPVSQSIRVSSVIDGKFNELISGMSGRPLLSPPRVLPIPKK